MSVSGNFRNISEFCRGPEWFEMNASNKFWDIYPRGIYIFLNLDESQ